VERIIWHFSPDQANTPVRYNLLMRIGGGSKELGLGKGIHWHINPMVSVRYWARDRARDDIPWIEVKRANEPPRIYRSADCPDPLPKDAEIRMMDCVDCHNRPSHVFRSPGQLVDQAMATGALDRSLPYLKRHATNLFEKQYPDTPTALKAISSTLQEKYSAWGAGPEGKRMVERNVDLLAKLYQRNFFPEFKVNWRAYPDHAGHFESSGCYRCHDNQHKSADNRVVSNDCRLCHDLVDQAEGEAAFAPPQYRERPFQHPRNLGEIWRGRNCTDCHGLRRDAPQSLSASVPSR
jgi:hypothetical protein